MSLKLLSKARKPLKAVSLEFASDAVAPGALLRTKTFASVVPESATANCRVSTPVRNKLTPAIETLLGNVAGPLSPSVLSASRPPQPVWLTEFAIEVEYNPLGPGVETAEAVS